MSQPTPASPSPSDGAEPAAVACSSGASPLPRQRPILASEALREDLAPFEPWSRGLRVWIAGLAVGMLGLGVAYQLRLVASDVAAAQVAMSVGAGGLAAAVLPFPYLARGIVVTLAGLTPLVLGLLGQGPLRGLVPQGEPVIWEASRALAASVLPAALLFRARYRAYGGARVALLVGLLVALPAAGYEAIVLSSGPLPSKLSALLALLSILASCLGFMGAGTTAASTLWASSVIVTLGATIVVRAAQPQWTFHGGIAHGVLGLGFMLASTMAAVGLFQVLAAACARDARRVDVLRKQPASAPQGK